MFNNSDLFAPSSEVIKSHVEYCIPEELIPSDWKCTDKDPLKNLDNLLSLSDGKLDEYGSTAETFLEYLKSAASFPGSWSLLKNPKTAVYNNSIPLYKSLGKSVFVYKRDLYTMLHYSIQMVPLKELEAEIAVAMTAYFLKIQEEKIDASEMTEADPKMFAPVRMEIEAVNHYFIEGSWKLLSARWIHFNQRSFEETSSIFINFLHNLANQEGNGEEIVELLKKYSEKRPINQNGSSYHKILTWVCGVTSSFHRFIFGNPELMMASEQVPKPKPESKIILRLIQSKDQKLVLAHELYQRMKMGGFDVSGLEEVVQGMPDVGTITFRQVFELVPKDLMKNIEFVPISVKHLIPLVNGGYCFIKDGELVKYVKNDAEDEAIDAIDSDGQSVPNSDEEVSDTVVENIAEEKRAEEPKKTKTKTQKKKKTTSQNPVLTKKESESCQKCFRASSFTRMANEKLKSEKITTKQLRKRLAELEMENLEKDEKIRALTTTVETLKMELEDKDEVIRSQKEQVEEAQKQLDSNIETIEDLESAISLAPVSEVTREEGTPTRGSEDSEKVRDALLYLLNIQATLQKEAPIQTVRTMTHKLTVKSSCAEVQKRLRFETIMYRQACNKYIEAVELNLSMIRSDQQITADQIPELPPFPTLSQWFQDTYKTTMKTDAPIICKSLIKTPESDPNELVDKECLICLEHMDSEEETIKCECCKRRYHGDCIKEWFKTKRMCPTCNSGMLDAEEFPIL